MKTIKSVTLKQFKGQTKQVELEKINLLVGPNGSGKSAVLDAIQFGISGSIGDRKLEEDVFRLASGRQMAASLAFDDAFWFERKLGRHGDKLKMEIAIGGESVSKLSDAEQSLSREFGERPEVYSVAEFTALSADKKRDRLLDLAARAKGRKPEVDPRDILARILLEFLRAHEEFGPATVQTYFHERFNIKEIDATFDQLREYCQEKLSARERDAVSVLVAALHQHVVGEPSVAIGAALDAAARWTNQQDLDAQKAQQAAQELSTQKSLLTVPAGDIQSIREGVDVALRAREAAKGLIEAAKERKKRVDSVQGRLNAVIDAIRNTSIDIESRRGLDVQLAELKRFDPGDTSGSELAALNGRISEMKIDRAKLEAEIRHGSTNGERIARLQRDIAAVEAEMEKCEAEAAKAVTPEILLQLEADVKRLTAEREKARDALSKLRARKAVAKPEIGDSIIHAACAKCRAAVQEALEQAELTPPTAEALKKAEAREKEAGEAATVAAGRHTEAIKANRAKTAYDDFARRRTQLKADLEKIDADADSDALAGQLNDLNTKLRNLESTAVQMDIALNESRSAKTRVERDIALCEQGIREAASAAESLKQLQADKATIETELAAAQAESTGSLEFLEAEYTRCDADVANRHKALSDFEKYQATDMTLTNAIANAEGKKVAHAVGKLIVGAIKTLRESIMQEMIAPVTDLMNQFLMGVDASWSAFILLDNPTGKRVIFRMGLVREGKSVDYEALSGGEHAIFVAALAFALTTLANPPLKLLLIEAGELDGSRLVQLLDGLVSVQHEISNCVVATWSSDAHTVPGEVNVVRMGASEVVAA